MIPIKLCPYELSDQIEILREEMVMSGLSEGLCSEETIKISQELDYYIAIYISIINNMNEMSFIR